MKITSEEIAKKAEVSRSTVSRVVNNYPNVPEETRRRVMDIIEKYDYEPNSVARILAGKTSHTIALCISDTKATKKRWKGTASSYVMRLTAALVLEGKSHGYMISIYVVSEESDFGRIENMFLNREISGGVFVDFEFEMEAINRLIARGFNMVVIDPGADMICADNVAAVRSQNEEAGYLATRYLLQKGHRYVAHLSGDDRLSSCQRMEGFKKAMMEAGFREDELLIKNGDFNRETTRRAAQQLLKSSATAIYVANDYMAIIAMRVAAEMNIRVPEDIQIVGCDYNEEYEEFGYNLTTIELSVQDIARAVVNVVIGKETKKCLICEAKFKEGETA